MKKLIAVLLVAVMCLSFVACGNNTDKENTDNNAETYNTQISNKKAEAEKAIVGIWKSENNFTATFNADNTAVVKNEDGEITNEIRWKYDDELELYVIVFPQQNPQLIGTCIENDNGVDCLDLGSKFYRQDA